MSERVALNEPEEVLRVLQSKQETKAFYNKIAKVYDLLAERSEQPMRAAGLMKFDPQPGQSLLEIGFGTGHVLADLAWSVGSRGKVFGIDLSDRMVATAQERLDKEKLSDWVELHCGDAQELPYDDEAMDGVIMSFTLELFDTPDIPQVLAECRRVLRPGGRIVVVGMSKEGNKGLVIRTFEWTHRHFPNLMDCRPIFVERSLAAAGFVIEDATVDHMWVPVEIVRAVKPV